MRQRLAQGGAAAVDAGADGAELDVEGGRDLLVGEALDVAEDDGGAELRWERVERRLDVVDGGGGNAGRDAATVAPGGERAL